MALISTSTYSAPKRLINGHIETIYPAIFRKVHFIFSAKKFDVNTPDGDFFDLNYYDNHSSKTVIISHGLEGNNERSYILGMAKVFFSQGWNVIAWNYRGCNGKLNNTIKSYHSGFTEDLEEVIKFADTSEIETISLVGFSLGGNLTLKYLGENDNIHAKIKNAVTLSVPLDLYQGCLQLSKPSNYFYSQRFLRTLKQKIRDKAVKFPEIPIKHLESIKDLKTFDDFYTAPLHGFRNAMDYYQSCSSLYVVEDIDVPTLIINALNDPFLPKACYPFRLLGNHNFVFLETPKRGGHVGFTLFNQQGLYWSEKRALDFIESSI